jgi:methylamine utilization protein MauE
VTELCLIARLTIGTVFLLSAAGKLRAPRSFAHAIEDYEILPGRMVAGASIFIIVVESWLAIAHLLGWWLRLAVPVGLGIIASFTVAVAINLRRGRTLPCYCFDATGGESISRRTLARLLLLLSTEVFLLANPNLFPTNRILHEYRGVELGLAFFWATFLMVVLSWIFSLPELAEVLRPSKIRAVQAAASDMPRDSFPPP